MANPSDKAADCVGSSGSAELAALMAKYGPALRRYFERRADPGMADDLVQDVFLRLQISAERSSLEDAERYIFTVAKRVLLNRRKLDARRGAFLHDSVEDAAEELSDDITPERSLAGKQEFERVMVSIMGMPPRMQTAFILHRFGRMSFAAIAKRMGIGKSAVQGLMERAIARITNGDAP